MAILGEIRINACKACKMEINETGICGYGCRYDNKIPRHRPLGTFEVRVYKFDRVESCPPLLDRFTTGVIRFSPENDARGYSVLFRNDEPCQVLGNCTYVIHKSGAILLWTENVPFDIVQVQ
ncbi:MAG: hypothetical protein A2945_01335 [Candidatus Liptonbacteria bacterium RIFCSPLOWO2_01_FULL_52_25]|uniref:Uncharacterized protein n=1 Tax=Candidatus Liptonbacteria bacterium RIFCSPLOWO2_01_FULL_52_25 TaxID=1798650 RepID=A0A1G2CDM0_9BACT|nr:MAG: hypothetical protein A2945_01335 [Candidatus Liptonbacteria bacterium RIFCSPLOWO2_01_FULL_52_25]